MNIDLKKNKILVVGGGVLGLLTLVAGYFLWSFSGAHKEAREGAETARSSLTNLTNRAVTPSPENVAILDGNMDFLHDFFTNYNDRLFSELPEVREMTLPSEFNQALFKVRDGIVAEAEAKGILLGDAPDVDEEVPVGVPKEEEIPFYMDFDRYLGEGEKPLLVEVPRLNLQVALIDDFIECLFNASVKRPDLGGELRDVHVKRLRSVRRMHFEQTEDLVRGGPAGFNPEVFGAPPTEGGPEAEPELPLYDVERFVLDFTGDEGILWAFANCVNQLPYPAAITRLTLKNQNEFLQPFEEFDREQFLDREGAGPRPRAQHRHLLRGTRRPRSRRRGLAAAGGAP